MSLKEYRRKRKFERTPEPKADAGTQKRRGRPTFVIQKHAATRVHYDFRLEIDGVLKSWAVPKGPSLRSSEPRLAVLVEDHPLPYGKFEGVIPKGNYGAGTVMIWDRGTFLERGSKNRKESDEALKQGLSKGHITFILEGEKLNGEFALVKIKKKGAPENGWLLVKKHDAHASRHDILTEDRSVASGRSMEEIASESEGRGDVWIPKKGIKAKAKAKGPAGPAGLPRRVRVMEPLFGIRPEASGWIVEPFRQGHRAIAEVEPREVKLYSRAFMPFEKKYPKIVSALKELGIRAVFDGEILGQSGGATYAVSDLLYFEGKDLREEPLSFRKKLLSKIPFKKPVETVRANDRSPFLVAKKLDSPYVGGLTREWIRFRKGASAKKGPVFQNDKPPITHPDKIFWPKERITKGDLAAYYEKVADFILPHLVDRPQSLHRQPDGIRNEGFFHKDMSSYLPRRIQTIRIFSGSSGKTINYSLCQDKWSLLYLVNLGCIELNPWLSKKDNLDRPELLVIDLDPDGNDFKEVIRVAQAVNALLKRIGVESFLKTSGATGLHICVSTAGKYDYGICREFAEAVCRAIQLQFPKITSVERNPAKRRGKIYLDFLQNRRAQTLAAPYCVRPRPGATVSTPLKWSELKPGLKPEAFTIKTIPARLNKVGDLWRDLLKGSEEIPRALKRLAKEASG